MATALLWDLIDPVTTLPDLDDRIRAITAQLIGMPDESLAAFRDQVQGQLSRAARADLFAGGVLLTGRHFDEPGRFEAFRCLLLLRGREVFEDVLAVPDRLARHDWSQQEKELDFDAEMLLYAPYLAYQERHGEDADLDEAFPPAELPDENDDLELDPAQVKELFPNLWGLRRAMIRPRETEAL